jgi:hypothetical protein
LEQVPCDIPDLNSFLFTATILVVESDDEYFDFAERYSLARSSKTD